MAQEELEIEAENTLVLIDAMALVHRAFYAIPPLTRHNQPVNAAYGFTATLLFVLKELKPKHIAVTYDEKGPTFRHKEYKEYKATRSETPDALKSQFKVVREIVEALGIPSFGVEGFEADDIIGTLAKQATKEGKKTIIVTGDHDLYQLINDSVQVYNVSRGTKGAELIDEAGFQKKYGFKSDLMTDYKGLRGDTSDNIPGIPGVGPKTAKQLITQYGSVEELYQVLRCDEDTSPAKVTSKVRAKLCEHKDSAFMSKKLATIHVDVPVTLNLAETVVKDYNEEKAKKLINHWGFKSLVPRLPSANPISSQETMF